MKKMILVMSLLAVSGCMMERDSAHYALNDAQRLQIVYPGTVDSVKDVFINQPTSGVGTLAGAGLGATAGASVGQGGGAVAGAIVGAVAGGVAGELGERQLQPKPKSQEIRVKLDNGTFVAVAQNIGKTEQPFAAGESVKVLVSATGTSRVVR